MLLGRITGKITTLQFSFDLQPGADVRKFEYVKVHHRVYDWVLCQVVEMEVSHERTLCKCHVLGYKKDGAVEQIRIPFDVEAEVFLADNEFIRAVIQLDGGEAGSANGAYLGRLDGKEIDVKLDLGKLLTKHVAVLAKSGAGKSYAVGVLIEEIMEHKVPVLVIDPHGEYGKIGERNTEKEDKERMARFGVKPKAYPVREYGDPSTPGLTPLRLPNNLTQQELVQLIPGKLNNTQLGILYSAIKGLEQLNFDTLLLSLEAEESSAKWSIINLVEHLRDLGIFSANPIAYNELVKSGVCSVINMRGIAPEIQQVIVYKLAKDLFELRKVNKIPPFFLVIEEAHNYCPERSFGEATASKSSAPSRPKAGSSASASALSANDPQELTRVCFRSARRNSSLKSRTRTTSKLSAPPWKDSPRRANRRSRTSPSGRRSSPASWICHSSSTSDHDEQNTAVMR